MLKLLIADDEYLVLDSIKMIISKNVENVTVAATAGNGREAIEKAIGLKPDIVFMDIHMPGIDGIEAIRQIKAVNSNTIFVILTAYEYFNYAKEALNLGVFEYLLKPINKNKLIETLRSIAAAVDIKRDNLMKKVELTEKISNITPFLEGQFVTHKLFDIGASGELKFYENVFNISLKSGYAMVLLFEDREESIKLSYDKQGIYDLFNIKLKSLTSCLVGNPLSDRIIAFIPSSIEDSYELKGKSLGIANKVAEKMKGLSKLNYKIGIGRKYDAESFNKSCNEAYIAASVSEKQEVMHFEDVSAPNSSGQVYPVHIEKVFSNSILMGNMKEAKESFEEIYVWLIDTYGEDLDRIKSKLITLLFTIESSMPYILDGFNELKQEYIFNILKADNAGKIRIQFTLLLSELTLKMQNQRESNIDGIIPKVLEYLNNNYSNDISLNDAAKKTNISYHYLSKIFKEKIGKSFTDYLTELRIEKSMKLLANESLNIKEICQKIGYNDPNYYTKAFKRITGMTPTEYRLSINSRGSGGCIG